MNLGTQFVENRGKIKKIKSWRSIRVKIENIQDQRPRWKTYWNQRVILKLGKGEIELILKIKIQLRI